MTCACCQSPVSQDEIGLSCKLIGRGTRAYYCLGCLSAQFRVPEETLTQLAEHFRQTGCTLFSPAAGQAGSGGEGGSARALA